jgi:transposase-like protein
MGKVAPSQRLREELQSFVEHLEGVEDGKGALSELVRRAVGLIVQESLEAEQRDFIGRERYERGEGRGYRSGYSRGQLKTAEGRVEVERPQVREAGETYRSKLYEFLRGHSEVVERLATEMYARGLSTRDVEAAFTDERGDCLLSRSAVSEVTETLWEEYEAFQARDLSELGVLYLFLDGLYEPLRVHGVSREAVLCAWAITVEGRKVLLSLSLGGRESYEAWREFLRDLVGRGLESMRAEVKAHLLAIRDAPTYKAGEAAVKDFLSRFGREFPSACACLNEDLEALLAHLKLPWRHRKFVRTTNLIERSFVEERRRTKTLPRFFTEKSYLKLVHATLIRAAIRWQRISITPLEYEQLKLLYQELKITPAKEMEAAA